MPEIKYNVIGLCNVPELTSEQELNILFKSKQDQKDFFDSRLVSLTNEDGTTWTGEDISFLRDYQPIKVPFGLDELINVNYLYCINYPANYPIRYYFINSKEYINDNCTRLNIELDVIQTYQFYVEDRECFIEQAHEKRYRIENGQIRFNLNSTENQGLNYGDKYQVMRSQKVSESLFDKNILFYYIFTKGQYNTGEGKLGTSDHGIANGLTCYIGVGSQYKDNTGVLYNTYSKTVDGEQALTNFAVTSKSNAFLRNPYIYQVVVSPIPPINCKININHNDKKVVIDFNPVWEESESGYLTTQINQKDINCVNVQVDEIQGSVNKLRLVVVESRDLLRQAVNIPQGELTLPWFFTPSSVSQISDDYNDIIHDPYLNMYPYTFSKLFFNGNSIDIHHELCNVKHEGITEGSTIIFDIPNIKIREIQSLASQGNISIEVNNYPYNSKNHSEDFNYEYMLTMPNPPSLDVINDKYIDYMLQNKNQRQAGFDSVNLQLGLGAASSAFGIASSIVTGNPIGAIAGVGGLAGTIASSQMRVKQMQAQEQDIKNQPSDVRVGSGDIGYLINTGLNQPILTTFTIRDEYKYKIHNYFHRFGRRINKLASVKNMINTRKYFNYIKTVDYVAKGEQIDQDSLMKIQSVLNKGITFWHYDKNDFISHDIGNYNVNNCENMEATV